MIMQRRRETCLLSFPSAELFTRSLKESVVGYFSPSPLHNSEPSYLYINHLTLHVDLILVKHW